jgi:hypothetical protein
MKRSPKGLLRLEPEIRCESNEQRVESFIRDRLEWAEGVLKEAGLIDVELNKVWEHTRQRPEADPVHQALLVRRHGERLRCELAIAATISEDAGRQAASAAYQMMQFYGAANVGVFVQVQEPLLASALQRRDDLRDASMRGNTRRREARSIEHRRWQAEARAVWSHKPKLSKRRVAELVRRNLKLTDAVGTIEDRIKKPGEAR